jgi:hypothetical protein
LVYLALESSVLEGSLHGGPQVTDLEEVVSASSDNGHAVANNEH